MWRDHITLCLAMAVLAPTTVRSETVYVPDDESLIDDHMPGQGAVPSTADELTGELDALLVSRANAQ